jgi:MYXO-CTERM domain-containing protein
MLALVMAGCIGDELEVGEVLQHARVSDYFTNGCTTAVVLPLSIQVAEEVSCMAPNALTSFAEDNGVVFAGGAVIPFATPEAARDLEAAAVATGEIRINSAYRTVVQQYLLYEWFNRGRCGITAAATPGRSNHESGRAIDVGNYSAARAALNNNGWAQTVLPNDPVHFDHLDSPDLRGSDVLGFQRLWNRNNLAELLDEDGVYGPMTADAMRRSPAEGFADAGCTSSDLDGELVSIDGPQRIEAGAAGSVVVRVVNTGADTWPADAVLATAMPTARDSDFFDDDSWDTARQVTALGVETPPGGELEIEFALRAAADATSAGMTEYFQLAEADGREFGPLIQLSFEVTGDNRNDDSDPSGEPLDLEGGCSATGGPAGPWWIALLAIIALRRRRRP